MDEDLKQNLTSTDIWVRGLFMILFLVVYGFAKAILYLIVFFQFFHTLLTGKTNLPLLDFSENLCAYLYEILLYVSFNSSELPFPFAAWPDASDDDEFQPKTIATVQEDEPEEVVDETEEEVDEPVKEEQPKSEEKEAESKDEVLDESDDQDESKEDK